MGAMGLDVTRIYRFLIGNYVPIKTGITLIHDCEDNIRFDSDSLDQTYNSHYEWEIGWLYESKFHMTFN